jgi:hypothetical protein
MSTSAAAGGGPMKSVQPISSRYKVLGAVAASVAAVYVFWELQVRARAKLGHVPRTATGVRRCSTGAHS